MTEYKIGDTLCLNGQFVAVLYGEKLVHIGDELKYSNGHTVTVKGIGKTYRCGQMEVLLSGIYYADQDKLYAE